MGHYDAQYEAEEERLLQEMGKRFRAKITTRLELMTDAQLGKKIETIREMISMYHDLHLTESERRLMRRGLNDVRDLTGDEYFRPL